MTATQQHEGRPARAMQFLLILLALAAIILQVACSSTGGGLTAALPASVERAERLLRQGNHAGAAQMYETLAGDNPAPASADFALLAAREWLAANRPADATRLLGQFTTGLTPAQSFERAMLGIEAQLASGQAADAWRALVAQGEPRAPRDAARYLALQRRAAFATSRPLEGVRAGIALERLANNDADRLAARRELLSQLRLAVDRGVKLEPQNAREPLIRGWLELGVIAANAGRNPLAASGEIDRWRARYPGHPGITVAQAEILGPPSATAGAPGIVGSAVGGQVALLLPLTGRQAAAATMVRDGFFSAWYQLPESTRPSISVQDTGVLSVAEALARASNEGAQFIVGPLTREEVAAAAAAGSGRRSPLLALNFLPVGTATPTNLYQFALSPEDEARQIARRALAAGQSRAIVIAPSGDWGARVVAAFREELIGGGGDVIAQTSYDPNRNEFTAGITDALRINESRARHRRLEEVLGGTLEFEPRRRADVQFIFAAGQPGATRQIRPQLRFYYAGDVPTYMTSDGFDPDPAANRDLDGVLFPDMPWMLQEGGPVAETRVTTQQAWGDKGPRLPRLFAFGFDAFNLMQTLRAQGDAGRGAALQPLAGVTGRLSVDADRHVRRELDWAQVRNGQPRLIGVTN